MFRNGPYSAEKGYDLRAPYNVPMGEIRVMRLVEPFSISSLQKNTIVDRPRRPPRKCCYPSYGLISSSSTWSSSFTSSSNSFCKRSSNSVSTGSSKSTGSGSKSNSSTSSNTKTAKMRQKKSKIK